MKATVKDGKFMSSVKVGPKGQIVIPKEVPVSYTHLDVYKRQGYGSTRAVRCSLSSVGLAVSCARPRGET